MRTKLAGEEIVYCIRKYISKLQETFTMAGNGGQDFVLGIDLGTTTVKVSLVNSKDKSIVQTLSRETKATVGYNDLGSLGDEQDVERILNALQFCVSGLPKEKLLRVIRVGISGQMHGIMFWKARAGWTKTQFGRFDPDKTSQLVTWQDGRCSKDFLSKLPETDSHLRLATGMGCATIFWFMENKPLFLKDYDCAGTIQDFVVAMLCNLERPVMSIQNAASWGYFNTVSKQWNIDRLSIAGFPVHLLPNICDTGAIAGSLECDWYNIPEGTPIGAALGDLQCSMYSSLQKKHDAVLNISTSAQLAFQMPEDFTPPSTNPDDTINYFPYFNDRYLAVAASLTGGNTMAAFVKMLQQWTHELGLGVPENKIWERVLALGQDCHETDLEIVPTIYGERHKPDQHASVTHISTLNLTLGSVYRSLCRGIIINLYSMMSSEFLIKSNVKRIVGSGSALTKNHVLQEEIERLYKLPICYGNGVDAAVGAALVMLEV